MLLSPPGSCRLPRRSEIRFGVPDLVPPKWPRVHGANGPIPPGNRAPDAYRLIIAVARPARSGANYIPS
jgi:hypothetical protein